MNKSIVIDATGHVAGKLAAFIAKRLLKGYEVTVVAVQDVRLTGPLHRHLGKYKSFKEKRAPYNPERGAFHWSQPSMYFKHKILRGMVARKTKRGAAALANLTCYEGIPTQFMGVERLVVPHTLLQVTTDCNRVSCTLGELLSHYGWHHASLAKTLTDNFRAAESKALSEEAQRDSQRQDRMKQDDFKREVERRLAEFA